jgi:hypothetical protein
MSISALCTAALLFAILQHALTSKDLLAQAQLSALLGLCSQSFLLYPLGTYILFFYFVDIYETIDLVGMYDSFYDTHKD